VKLPLALLTVIAAAAFFGPVAVHVAFGGGDIDLLNRLAGPSTPHPLGTDELGRDVLTRLIYGTRVTLGVAALTILMAVVVGTSVGMTAGYYGGWADEILMRGVDMLLSIPPILLFILLAILLAPGPVTLSAIIAFVAWGGVSRLVRAETLAIRNREYMTATRSLGASDRRWMVRHVLPNVLPIMSVAASLAMVQVILAEAALDFLGRGIHPPTPSWGSMIADGRDLDQLRHSPWTSLCPGLAIGAAVLGFNLLGDALRDALDPRAVRSAAPTLISASEAAAPSPAADPQR